MKNLSPLLKTKLLRFISGLVAIASITACGNSTINYSNGAAPTVTPTAVTIDNAGVIPVFGNSSTSTVVYVHNNTNKSISGISYSLTTNVAHTSLASRLTSLSKRAQNLASIDASQCLTVAANQACPIAIATPMLNGLNTQGSIQIKASYNLDNHPQNFTQLISYSQVQNNVTTSGAKFQSGVTISGYGNPTGYATIYLYGSGQNQVYDVSSITINKPAIAIVNGNISGQQIQSNFVQAVEISSPIANSSMSAAITVDSNIASKLKNNSAKNVAKALNDTAKFSNSADITVEPVTSGAVLTTGLVPLINTASTTSGRVLVHNNGNQTASLGSITAGNGISSLSGCSNSSLVSGGTCTISFNVTESSGNANITIPYTGGSANNVVANVTWYNKAEPALVSMSSSVNPLSFFATVGGSTTITVTNIGGANLSNINIPAPVVVGGGNATATLGTNNCATINSLEIGSSCEYIVNVNDSQIELGGQINVGFNASYAGGTKSYNQMLPITYNSTNYGPILTISPNPSTMTISGNSIESITQDLIISNNGNLPADLTSLALSDNPEYMTLLINTCGAALNAESSCSATLKLGPTFSRDESSGTALFTIAYVNAGQTPTGSVSSNVNWVVQPYNQSISLVEQTAFGITSGNGESVETSYIFTARGRDVIGKSITLTYKNTGTHGMKITGIQDANSVYAWKIGGKGTTCIPESITLAPNDTCKIVYDNVLESNILALGVVGATYTENLLLPRLIYQDVESLGIQFNAIPALPNGSDTIYAKSNQGTLANSITISEAGTLNESVTVSHLLANADDALNVTVTTKMEDYFITAPGGTPSACTYNSADGIMTQTCIMGKDDLSMSATYLVNQNYFNKDQLTLTALFSVDNLSQIVSMNPLGINIDLGKIPTFVGVGTGGVILSSQDGVNWESASISSDYFNGITFADNKYVVVGNSGAVYTSSNARNWTSQVSGTVQELFEVIYGNSLFVSVGCQGTIITSPTGVNWSSQTGINYCDIYGIAYGNGLYVATGQNGYIQTSPNAINWTEQQNVPTNEELTAVTYGGGKYIAVGTNGTILYSANAVDWSSADSGISAQIGAVIYANNQYVAVTRDGGVLTSADGMVWNAQVTNNVNPLYGIAYSNGQFVAVGTLGTILTSPDAVNWTTQTSITSESLYGITSVN